MTMPTADQIAAAIVTASRFMDVHPEETVGARPTLKPVAAARARSYAAMAIDKVFNTSRPTTRHSAYPLSRVAIARMVGAPKASQDGLVNGLERKLAKRHDVGWWVDQEFWRVIDAINGVRAAPEQPTQPPARRDAVTAVARPRAEPTPSPDPAPKPAPQPRAPITSDRTLPTTCPCVALTVKGDIRVEPRGWKIHLRDTATELRDMDAFRVVALLARVSPALLVTEDMAARLWPSDRDGKARVKQAVARATPALTEVGLKIGEMPKFGYSLSEG